MYVVYEVQLLRKFLHRTRGKTSFRWKKDTFRFRIPYILICKDTVFSIQV